MKVELNVGLIFPNCILREGVLSILSEFFVEQNIKVYSSFGRLFDNQNISRFSCMFIPYDSYLVYKDKLELTKCKCILLTTNNYVLEDEEANLRIINLNSSKTEFLQKLNNYLLFSEKAEDTKEKDVLSPREIEVLKLVAQGLQNKTIADQLYLSTNTVISHRKNINRKLGIYTVSGLTVYALINGLISPQ